MIETRDSRNSRPLHQSPDRKHRGKQQHQHQQQKKADNYPSMMYGTLKGEDLLDNSGSSLDNINDGNNMSSTPQSVEMGQYSSSEYHQPLMNGTTATTTTKIQNNNISPLSGLPPAIPLRRRADSSGDRSMGELSTVSGVSGHNRIHRTSSSDGYEQVLNNHYNNNSTTLSPGSTGNYYQSPGANSNMSSNNNYAIPPKPSMVPRQRSSNNTRPVRRRSRSPSPSHSTPGSSSINGQHQQHQQQYYIGHPLHQRRPSEEYMMQNQNAQNSSSNRHRRTHSYDATPQLHRGNSSNSLYSMNSQGSSTMNSEQMKLLPDPRWGGGSGGSRTRSYSGDRVGQSSQSIQMAGVQQMNNNNGVGMSYSSEEYSSTRRTTSYSSDLKTTMGIAGSYSNDSQEQQQPQQVEVTSKLLYSNNNVGGYGSIVNNNSSGAKEVISDMMMMMNHGGEMQPLVRGNHHRRSNSEVSVSTYASGVSVDRSVEPVMTDMTKSAMFKGVTNKGVVKLQLPKDNFRLLSDRDLGEFACFAF